MGASRPPARAPMTLAPELLLNAELIDVAATREWFHAHGLGRVWDMLRDYMFSVKVILGGLIPCLILERFFPARERTTKGRPGLLLDYLYPVLIALFASGIIWGIYGAMTTFYDRHLAFLNVGLLDGKAFWIQALGAFLITDLMFWVSHFIRHKVPWLWHFHTIHHSQRDLNPMTTHRNHPLEFVSIYVVRTIPIAVVGGAYEPWALYAVLNHFWGYFIHANVRTNLGPVGRFLVSPQYHRVHHSLEEAHIDKNFGERLVVWDWMFGTLYRGRDEYPDTGVHGCGAIEEQSNNPLRLTWTWVRQLAYPLVMIGRSIARFGSRFGSRAREATPDGDPGAS